MLWPREKTCWVYSLVVLIQLCRGSTVITKAACSYLFKPWMLVRPEFEVPTERTGLWSWLGEGGKAVKTCLSTTQKGVSNHIQIFTSKGIKLKTFPQIWRVLLFRAGSCIKLFLPSKNLGGVGEGSPPAPPLATDLVLRISLPQYVCASKETLIHPWKKANKYQHYAQNQQCMVKLGQVHSISKPSKRYTLTSFTRTLWLFSFALKPTIPQHLAFHEIR